MNRKRMSLRVKAILLVAFFMLITNMSMGFVLTWQARNATRTQINAWMLDIVNTAAGMLDGDVLEKLTAEDEGTPAYQDVKNTLSRFLENSELNDIYYLRKGGDGSFTFGIDPDPAMPGEFGTPFVNSDALEKAGHGVDTVNQKPYEDAWGRFYSAFSPVFNTEGKVVAVVAADFDADWYETQINQTHWTVVIGCILSLAMGIVITIILTGVYNRQMEEIKENVCGIAEDMDSLTREFTGDIIEIDTAELRFDDMKALGQHVADLRSNIQSYISHTSTQANSMITAMASDYRCVYYVNLDDDSCVCYRDDPTDLDQTPVGIHFPYFERLKWYAEHHVTETYREGFISFIDPVNVREALSSQPIIAYRYLAKRDGREYYEMIRMAGVRRAEERDDDTVHAAGFGLTEIDAEMRESMAKNETLAEALALAEEASKAKTAFLSNMSHEIRTPMNAIIGLDNLALHDETLSEQTRDYLERIGGSAHHLLSLINDILDMSRIESGRLVLRKEEFSFSAMLEQINTMVMSQCRDKGLSYQCRVLSQIDDYYIGDDTKLKEVLINILSNAIKFTEAPGSVTLTVERTAVFEDQSTLKMCIRDTGIGMDPEYIPKIFEPFSQEDSSRKNKFGSTGLGMAITKSIVEMMNGTIAVESEKGVGTQFTVTVTLKRCERQQEVRDDAVDHSRLRVLVVDDDEIAAEHAQMALDEAGIHRVDICFGGEEAIHMLEVQHTKQDPYNLVLMDRRMPGMDGIEVTRRIRASFGNETTVIILTAYNWDDILEEAQQAGVDSFLAKPIFASNVIAEFDRIARRNNLSLFEEKKRAELAGRHILLAEDMEINAEIMMDLLEMEEMTADHAENGRIALEKFQQSDPGTYDAILMDVRMPEMDGLEATAAIRAVDRPDARTIPIIAMTANAFDEDVQRSLQAGMNAHLSKPVEPDNLYRTLGELIYEAEAANVTT